MKTRLLFLLMLFPGLAAAQSYTLTMAPTNGGATVSGSTYSMRGTVSGSRGPLYNADNAPLPVELHALSAVVDGSDVRLAWTTASETNNAGFDVQYAPVEATSWTTAAFVEGHGTTTEAHTYVHPVPALAPGRYRFRLAQRDYDGALHLSQEVEVLVVLPEALVLGAPAPNPVTTTARFTLAVRQGQHVEVDVFDVHGRRVARVFDAYLAPEAPRSLLLDTANWASGLYLVRAKTARGIAVQRLSVVR